MFDIDERGKSAAFLRLCNNGERERGFAGRFWTENFDDSSPRKPAYPKRAIDENVAGRNDIDIDNLVVTQAHDRAVAVILGNLLNGQVEIFVSRGGQFICAGLLFGFGRHIGITLSKSLATIRQAQKLACGRRKRKRPRTCGPRPRLPRGNSSIRKL